MPSVNDILGIIMGGGQGSRLYPLTKLRAKPAVPIAGKYRLIDIPISNCINAGIHRIAVLTQFNSVSLHRHISQTYQFDSFSRGWVQILAAEQTPESMDWYQGTADAVRKQIFEIKATNAKYTLILAGDHLYRMDYDELAKYHWDMGADITVAMQPVHRDDASRFGLLKTAKNGQITDFAEKPKEKSVLEKFITREDPDHPYLGSMGIYMFNTEVLIDLLSNFQDADFGGELIPRAIKSHEVFGYHFNGYWEDIGTIRSFYETNLSLTQEDPPYKFNSPTDPIYSRPRYLPSSVINGSKIDNVLLADGCHIHRSDIKDSVIGLRSHICENVTIRSSIIMGADYFDTQKRFIANRSVAIGIGEGSHIEGAIIDKNARIGPNVIIKPFPRGTEIDTDEWSVRDGIIVVPKSTVLPEGTKIGPEFFKSEKK
ncbi:MAG: glucose-1-phosphate adenylyltransferase [Chloroflexi bacterium]|jgi:glucose-1-phosphate adenylyltransferase|nr:glucose-1-phosphate adenylyltransferase [Chloroflexota bacterium]MBT3669964.1 glucose-1-phosphate adenylyltransferase [Chloroflexota bacterium]MBT4534633.1 glucose-1-phosphate adenylyltransferase [Chloroflexota bacterium]MBT4755689.1 glucose-1-phosphate adenylyltransferase [Chloroflexota bacterium]MBT6358331.1 glucose-1-phosphate adenylyltransferase [Chloroflexota bacterium]